MPVASFRTKDVVTGQRHLMSVVGFCEYYATEEPNVPVIGDWRERFCTLQKSFTAVLDRVYNFEVREDDVWVVTYPKCGTTWTQEMSWLIMNDYDFDKAKEIDLTKRSPFLEFNGIVPKLSVDTIEEANKLPSPRVIKSHLPIWLLPKQIWTKKAKVIYVFRNPKDVAVSLYHHWRGLIGYEGSKENIFRSLIDDTADFNPFWMHVLDFWNLRNEPNIFFTSYERMKSDLAPVIRELCAFLDKNCDEDKLDQLLEHLSFDNMKNNKACSHADEFKIVKEASGRDSFDFTFLRRGQVNSHKDEMPSGVIEDFDKWSIESLAPYNVEMNDFIKYSK